MEQRKEEANHHRHYFFFPQELLLYQGRHQPEANISLGTNISSTLQREESSTTAK